MNNIFTKIFDTVLIILAIIGILFFATWAYYKVTDKGLYTDFVATYAASVTDKTTNEKLPVMQAKYFENYNNTGKEVVEFQINCYSDHTMPTVLSKGYQLVKEKDGKQTLYYVDGYHGTHWQSMHPYDEKNDEGQLKEGFYISINDGKEDKVYGIRMDGTHNIPKYTLNGGKVAATVLTGGLGFVFGSLSNKNWSFYDVKYEQVFWTMEEFMNKLAASIKSCSYGTGEYSLPLVDMGDFWHVYEIDENGKFSDTPIGNNAGNVLVNSYFAIDISYSHRGILYAGQSMFGSVAGDNNYNMTGIEFDVDYWKANSVYNVTENDFDKRYSSADSGFYYALSEKKLKELKTYAGMEINVEFNVSNLKNVNVLGFDYYALNGLQINKLTIKSDKQRDFNLLYGSLEKTGLKIEDVETSNIKLIDLGGNAEVAA